MSAAAKIIVSLAVLLLRTSAGTPEGFRCNSISASAQRADPCTAQAVAEPLIPVSGLYFSAFTDASGSCTLTIASNPSLRKLLVVGANSDETYVLDFLGTLAVSLQPATSTVYTAWSVPLPGESPPQLVGTASCAEDGAASNAEEDVSQSDRADRKLVSSGSGTPKPTPTQTSAITPTRTPTSTHSKSQSSSPTATLSPCPVCPPCTASHTDTPTASRSATATRTATQTLQSTSATRTGTPFPSSSETETASPSLMQTPTLSTSSSETASVSMTPTQSTGFCSTASNCVPYQNMAATCVANACQYACLPSFSDCNGNRADGCEVNTALSAQSCGGCGVVCSSHHITAPVCAGGVCVGQCNAGFTDCDNNKQINGCETNTGSDTSNCGACAKVCSLNAATAACSTGNCVIATCNPGWADCNNYPADGCEIYLHETNNCGSCGNYCSNNHGTPSCASGSCQMISCSYPYGDCNGYAGDGCETPLTLNTNCGTCGHVCGTGTSCSSTTSPPTCM